MNEVEEVKARLEVAEVVGGYVQLKQAGRNLKAPCPFHQEKSASFMVSPEKGIWHCFGCGQGGDIFKFVMAMEGIEFREALELLARRAGVELKARGRGSGEDGKTKDRLYQANQWAAKYFQANLAKNPRALDYVVKRRGLKRSTIQDFVIGYAPESWDGLIKLLRKKGFSESEMIKAGLVGQRSRGSGVYDLFRGRIMFTIGDAQGRPIGFTARVLDDLAEGPKYLNTPQTALYDKSRAIYGFHLAREAIRASNEVVLVEGNMDVVASHQAGTRQVVAASGTALTLDQLKSLSRLTKNIKLAFDQDEAGLRATERAIELGQKLGLVLMMITIRGAKDPDELIKKDPSQWQKAIAGAQPVVDYLFDRFAQDYDLTTALGKRQYSDRLALNLHRLADPIEQDHYVKRLALKLDATPEQVKAKVDQATRGEETGARREGQKNRLLTTPSSLPPVTAKTRVEEAVLAINLAYPEARVSLGDVEASDFASADHAAICAQLNDNPKASSDQIAAGLPNLSDYVKILTLRGEEEYASLSPADRSFEAFELSRRLQIMSRHKSQADLIKQLRVAETNGNAELAHSLLQEYQALIKED